jgi:hypothetical protein
MLALSCLEIASYAEFLVLVSATQLPFFPVLLGDDVNHLLLVNFPKMCKQVVVEELTMFLEALHAVVMTQLSAVHQCWPAAEKGIKSNSSHKV